MSIYILSSYDPKLIEYKELSRERSFVSILHNLEDVLFNYQTIFGGIGDIPRFKHRPLKPEHKEGLYIHQTCLSRLVLYNRSRDIGYVWNSFDDKVVSEFVITKLVDMKLEAKFIETSKDDYYAHEQNMGNIFDFIKKEGEKIKPIKGKPFNLTSSNVLN